MAAIVQKIMKNNNTKSESAQGVPDGIKGRIILQPSQQHSIRAEGNLSCRAGLRVTFHHVTNLSYKKIDNIIN